MKRRKHSRHGTTFLAGLMTFRLWRNQKLGSDHLIIDFSVFSISIMCHFWPFWCTKYVQSRGSKDRKKWGSDRLCTHIFRSRVWSEGASNPGYTGGTHFVHTHVQKFTCLVHLMGNHGYTLLTFHCMRSPKQCIFRDIPRT